MIVDNSSVIPVVSLVANTIFPLVESFELISWYPNSTGWIPCSDLYPKPIVANWGTATPSVSIYPGPPILIYGLPIELGNLEPDVSIPSR